MIDKQLKERLIKLSLDRENCHIGSCLSCINIIDNIYNNKSKDDIFVLSKAHAGLALYCVLNKYNIISDTDIETYYTNNSIFSGHVSKNLKINSFSNLGSLANGVSFASGIALANNIKKTKNKVYCLCGDGETNEGMFWEALQFCSSKDIKNFIILIDKNNLQGIDKTDNVFGDIISKINGIVKNVIYINDENFYSINFDKINDFCVIIVETVKGSGFKFLENIGVESHYIKINKENIQGILNEN